MHSSSSTYSTLLAMLPVTAMIWDASKQEVLCSNQNIVLELGYLPTDVPENKWFELIDPTDAFDVAEYFKNSSAPLHKEVRFKLPSGELIWYSVSTKILADTHDNSNVIITFTPVKHTSKLQRSLYESHKRFKGLAEASFGGIAMHDKGIIIDANQALASMTGYSVKELIGMDGLQLIAPPERERVMQHITSGYEKPYRSVGKAKSGQEFPLEIRGKQIPYKGKVVRVTEFRNIEEQVRFEQAIADSEKRFRDIIEFAVDGFVIGNMQGIVISTNQRFLEIAGRTRDEVIGSHIADFFDPKVVKEKPFRFDLLNKGQTVVSEREIFQPDGTTLVVEMHSKRLPNDTYQAIIRDVTERNLVRQEVEKNEAKFRALFNYANDAIFLMDTQGFVDCNQKTEQLFGCPKSEIVGKTPADFSPISQPNGEPSSKLSVEYMRRAFSGESLYFEWVHEDVRGIAVYTEISLNLLTFGGYSYLQAIVRDITSRKAAERALDQERLLIQNMMENVVDQIYFKDLDSRFIRASRNVAERFGLSQAQDIVGKSDFDFFSPEHAQMAYDIEQKIIETAKPIVGIEERETWPDGRITWASTTKAPFYDSKGNIIGTFGISRDITESKQWQEMHRQSEERFRYVIEATNDGLWDWNLIEDSIFFSDRYFTMLGYVPGEFESSPKSWENLLHPEDLVRSKEVLSKYLKEQLPEFNLEFRLRAKDNTWRWIHARGKIVEWDSAGNPQRIVGTHMDISDRKFMESELRESRNLLQSVLDTIPVRVFWKDKYLRFLGCNKPFASDAGFDNPNSLVGLTDYDMGWRNEAALYQADDRAIMASGRPKLNYEEPQTTPMGDVIWLKTSKIPLRNDQGEVVGILGTYDDITESKKSREQVELERTYFEQLFESSPEGIVVLDVNDCIIRTNSEFSRLFGYTDEEMEGKPINSLIVPDDFKDEGQELTNTVARGDTIMKETVRKRKDGSLVHVSILGHPIYFHGGKIAVYGIYRDITDRKQVEEELVQKTHEIEAQNEEYRVINEELYEAKQKAEESDRLKSAFLANMSHEIRTPMNGILGFTQLLTTQELSDLEVKEYVDIVQGCGNQLLSIINDLIDISKIEANQIVLSETEVNLNQLMYEQFLLFKPKAHEKNLEFSFAKGLPDDESVIIADSARVKQIIGNLLNNAFKFTQEGEVKFGYFRKDNQLQFSVEDSGVGISHENFESIFERFSQVETRLSEQTGGTGLGLAISKAYIKKMGGEIWVESTLGRGSAFRFTLPYSPKELDGGKVEVVSQHNERQMPAGVNLLVAEDDEVNFMYIREIFAGHKFNILWAKNGMQAIEMVRSNPELDIVLMDIKMPGMDGYQATAEIKKLRKNLTVIAQTAYAFASDRDKAIQAGCDDYISKPIDRMQLLTLISNYLKK
ncbi:MAG: PAS domain S-box protein [Tenuifilaceae bacterium]|nr:PAS domain S-box protein [Tenuifilaceae bacterium]